jgi:O-antigen/teichoic acid export membrane protein
VTLTLHIPDNENYLGLLRTLIKNSGIYAISALVSPLVSLALAPFLTRSLSKYDYGIFVVLTTAIALGTAITQLGLYSAITRAYIYDYETRRERLEVLSTSVVLLSLSSIIVTTLALLKAPWIADVLFGSSSFRNPIRITALSILVQNFTVPGFAWLRAEGRAKTFSSLAIANLLITLGASIVLVKGVHMGITGALVATGAGYGVVALCSLPIILFRAGLVLRIRIARNLLSFGIPLVFNSVSFWILQLSDRYLLSRFGSLAQTASYGVAYTLGGALNAVILAPFTLAWPTTMFTIAKRKDAPQAFQLVFRWFSLVLLFSAFVLALIAIAALHLLFPPSYTSATPIIPLITLSATLYGIYALFSVGVGIQRKTWVAALVMAFSALINIACNLLLIPLYGPMGAALSTLIAYVILVLIMYTVNQRIYPIPFEIGLFLVALLIGIALYIGSSLLVQQQAIYSMCAVYGGSTLLYGGCLALLGRLASRKPRISRKIDEDTRSMR